MFVTGLVLAADGSALLDVPKQLLPYQDGTLLGATLGTARDCGFDQLIVTLGGAAREVRERVELDGVRVVDTPEPGGRSSIVSALDVVHPRSDGIVLMLGDQPGVTPATVWTLVAEVAGPATPIGVCRYDDGRGHPFWFAREVFGELRALEEDRGVWQLLDSGRHLVTEVDAFGNVPREVGDWDDYQALLAEPEPLQLDTEVGIGPSLDLQPPVPAKADRRQGREDPQDEGSERST